MKLMCQYQEGLCKMGRFTLCFNCTADVCCNHTSNQGSEDWRNLLKSSGLWGQ